MSVILEAAVEGPNPYLQAKWLLLALAAYIFSSMVSLSILYSTMCSAGALVLPSMLVSEVVPLVHHS